MNLSIEPRFCLRLRAGPHVRPPNWITFSVAPLQFRPYNTHLWILQHDWTFNFRSRQFTIPKGFTTDFFSLPALARVFWPTIPGTLSIAALIHDYLVRYRTTLGISLPFAHAALRVAMRALGYPKRAIVFWCAVYACGWIVAGPGNGEEPKRILDEYAGY